MEHSQSPITAETGAVMAKFYRPKNYNVCTVSDIAASFHSSRFSPMDSSNFREPRSVTRGIAVIIKAGWHARRSIFVAWIARWARQTGAAASARMGAEPWLIRMVLAHPSAIVTPDALHRAVSAP
jgi:hypothetical protein